MRVVNRIALCITVLVALPGALALAGSPAADRTQRFAWSGWMPAARAAARQAAEAPAQADPDVYEAAFDFRFLNRPKVTGPAQAPAVAIEGESLWRNPGDPVVPVRFASLALPPGTEIADVHVELGPPEVIARDVDALATTPQPLPTDVPPNAAHGGPPPVTRQSFPADRPVTWRTVAASGYDLVLLNLFPVRYDAAARTVVSYPEMSVAVTTRPVKARGRDHLAVRRGSADRLPLARTLDNPSALDAYEAPAEEPQPTGGALPPGGPYDYVIITSDALRATFQTLADHKTARGVPATVVTTATIYASFTGTETGDNPDRIRDFIRQARDTWNTRYVLIGGDVDQVPFRGGYGYVSSDYVDNAIPTDMYYACLDGPWNNDGDSIWGESNDGDKNKDVDLYPDVFVGRAPAGNATQAAHFVAKTILYETTLHANRTHGVWLGEQLDSATWGGDSKALVRDGCFPSGWTLTERYEKNGAWTASQFVADLNASPHIINHNGHANATYNAKLYNSDVDALTNTHPYLMYSIGCISGNFQYSDSIAEHHVVYGSGGAFAVVMNSRYGWYWSGSTVGPSHYYDYEFWDAIFNEGLHEIGRAQADAKIDNLYRVSKTGSFRWCHFASNLLGDPQTPLWVDERLPSAATSTVTASPATIPDDGSQAAVVSVRLRTSAGEAVTGLAGMIELVVAGSGTSTLGPVVETSVGVYEATFLNDAPGEKTLGARLAMDGQTVTLDATATVTVEESLRPELVLSAAQFDADLGLMYVDLLFAGANGFSGPVTGFGARVTLSGPDAGHFAAAPHWVQACGGEDMATLVAPSAYAWNTFTLGVFATAIDSATMNYGHAALFAAEAVPLETLAPGSVVARFYYAWDGAEVSQVTANVSSYSNIIPTPTFTIAGAEVPAAVLNNGADVVVAGNPHVEVAAEEGLDWVYQNVAASLANGGHKVLLTVTVTDLNGNDSVTVSVAKAPDSGPGEVTFDDGPTGLQKYVVGGPRNNDTCGTLTLNVTVAGNLAGHTTAQVPFTVRRLGDIDYNGGAEPTDMAALVLALNGTPPPQYHARAFDLDANGGAEPADMALLVNILNGIALP
ncbi:MAG: hypothetical protein GXY74_08080 [Phycisphaerae bacterium]|nr:hypothetical protein [Phycisphaerae bacterium]